MSLMRCFILGFLLLVWHMPVSASDNRVFVGSSISTFEYFQAHCQRLYNRQPHEVKAIETKEWHAWLTKLPNLQSLDFSENQLKALTPEICQMTNLHELSFSHNQLTALPPEIGQLINLRKLDLYCNQLMVLPLEFGQLINLQILNLSRNQLTALPPEIGQCANLEMLYLSHNQLTALPPEIGQLRNLRKLDLSYNQLTALPPEIGQCANLEILDLSHNQLTAVPPEIGQCANLHELYLSHNPLTAVPPEIGQLRKPPNFLGNPLLRTAAPIMWGWQDLQQNMRIRINASPKNTYIIGPGNPYHLLGEVCAFSLSSAVTALDIPPYPQSLQALQTNGEGLIALPHDVREVVCGLLDNDAARRRLAGTCHTLRETVHVHSFHQRRLPPHMVCQAAPSEASETAVTCSVDLPAEGRRVCESLFQLAVRPLTEGNLQDMQAWCAEISRHGQEVGVLGPLYTEPGEAETYALSALRAVALHFLKEEAAQILTFCQAQDRARALAEERRRQALFPEERHNRGYGR